MPHELELALVALWCFIVAFAGGTAGLVLGNIRLPVMVSAAASAAAGAGANVGVSGIAAAAGAVTHIRAGRIDWRIFWWMAPASAVGAVVGGLLSGVVPERALLAAIAATLLWFGVDTFRKRDRSARDRGPERVRWLVVAGLGIGLLGGFVGLILGTLRLPALIRAGLNPAIAVGTNLTVGIVVGGAGVIGHLPGGVDWTLLLIGGAASIPGAVIGARLTGRLSTRHLLGAVGAILIVAGCFMIVDASFFAE